MVPSRAERVWWWYPEQDPGREKYCELLSVREDQSLYTRVRLHRLREKNGLLGGNYSTQSYHGAIYLLRDRACMTYFMCVLGLAEDLEARVLKSSPQTKAPGNTPRVKALPTQEGRRSLRRQRGRGGGCGANRFRRKTQVVFIS